MTTYIRTGPAPWSLDIPCWILDIRNPSLILYSAVSDRGYNCSFILPPSPLTLFFFGLQRSFFLTSLLFNVLMLQRPFSSTSLIFSSPFLSTFLCFNVLPLSPYLSIRPYAVAVSPELFGEVFLQFERVLPGWNRIILPVQFRPEPPPVPPRETVR